MKVGVECIEIAIIPFYSPEARLIISNLLQIALYFFWMNFLEILKLGKGENDTQLSKLTQAEQDTYEMQVRAANIGKIINK